MPTGGLTSRQIRDYRGPKQPVDAHKALRISWERERTDTGVYPTLTVFLSGAECPFTCVFCDLWKHTLDVETPPGAIPAQLSNVIGSSDPLPRDAVIKLYNASNFFDPRAVPRVDYPATARFLDPFQRIVVENHPRFVDEHCARFADLLRGELEVALGLETAHPDVHSRLNKGTALVDFERAFERLTKADIRIRAFVLLGTPFIPADDSVEWTVTSASYAIERGAKHVSIIPTRAGNGTLEVLAEAGDWASPTLADLERAAVACMPLPAVVTVDLWDAAQLSSCGCSSERIARLTLMNLHGTWEPPIPCPACGGSAA